MAVDHPLLVISLLSGLSQRKAVGVVSRCSVSIACDEFLSRRTVRAHTGHKLKQGVYTRSRYSNSADGLYDAVRPERGPTNDGLRVCTVKEPILSPMRLGPPLILTPGGREPPRGFSMR